MHPEHHVMMTESSSHHSDNGFAPSALRNMKRLDYESILYKVFRSVWRCNFFCTDLIRGQTSKNSNIVKNIKRFLSIVIHTRTL